MPYSDKYSDSDAPPPTLMFADDDQEVVYQDDFKYENSTAPEAMIPIYSRKDHARRRRRLYMVGTASVLMVVLIALIVKLATGGSGSSGSSGITPSSAQVNTYYPPKAVTEIDETEEILRSFSRHGGAEFDNPTSYQSRALEWLKQSTPMDNAADAFGETTTATSTEQHITKLERMFQRFGLACIYYATNNVRNAYTDTTFGEYGMFPWNNEQGWLQSEDECSWHGVTCNDSYRVEKLDLSVNSLTGSFPFEVTYMKDSLHALILNKNFFHNAGDDGLAFLADLKELRAFRSRDCYMQYEGFPSQFAYLEHLEELDLSYNVLYGTLSEDLFRDTGVSKPLPMLLYLDVSGNSFSGAFPVALAQLPNLQYLYAMNSSIQGDLSFVLQMAKPVEIWVDDNAELSGTVPSTISTKKSTLQSFSATKCSLTGSIPSTIGELTLLKHLWLSFNQLTGQIPPSLGSLSQLIKLELEDNDLIGTMPHEICAIHHPYGPLQDLQADCSVTCDCCDCCGDSCSRRRLEGRRLERKTVWV